MPPSVIPKSLLYFGISNNARWKRTELFLIPVSLLTTSLKSVEVGRFPFMIKSALPSLTSSIPFFAADTSSSISIISKSLFLVFISSNNSSIFSLESIRIGIK